MSSFGEVLSSFKSKEEPESIVPLVEDEDLRNGLVAWKSVVITYNSPGDCDLKDEASQWNWLWKYVQFDQTSFGTVAGVRGQDVGKLLERLIGLRLIYPDGTIHKQAKSYLQTIIWSKLKQVQPKTSKVEKSV